MTEKHPDGERVRRVGSNEAIFRAVNEEIQNLERGMSAVDERTLHIVCECGRIDCTQQIAVPVAVYEGVRTHGDRFLIVPGHEIPDVESVVEEGPDFFVVRKDPGEPAAIAQRTDPRGD